MHTQSSKIAFLFGLYLLLHLLEACRDQDTTNCSCVDVLPFFDYSGLDISKETVRDSSSFSMEISADSVQYLSSAKRWQAFDLISTAWACDCAWNGHDGPKFRQDKFNIYADRAFNDTLPMGASLNSIFFVNGGDVLIPLKADQPYDHFWAFGEGKENIRPLKVLCYERPTALGMPFTFRVEIVKANGEIVQAFSDKVVF